MNILILLFFTLPAIVYSGLVERSGRRARRPQLVAVRCPTLRGKADECSAFVVDDDDDDGDGDDDDESIRRGGRSDR
jgi:hypothetical protein